MNYTNILKIVPGLQAVSLAAYNIPKNFPMKPSKKMSMKQSKSIVRKGVTTLLGIGLLKSTAKIINKL